MVATIDLLFELLKVDSPSGDEGPMADWVKTWIQANCPEARVARLEARQRLSAIIGGEALATAIFAHLDTTGFTLGYESRLISIGSPAPEDGTPVREATPNGRRGLVREVRGDVWELADVDGVSRISMGPCGWNRFQSGDEIVSPYLDNRGGIWAALNALARCPSIAVAFTTGEEHSGQGAFVCARYLYENYAVDQALISDITWDTEHVHCGKGVMQFRSEIAWSHVSDFWTVCLLSLRADPRNCRFSVKLKVAADQTEPICSAAASRSTGCSSEPLEKHPHTDHEVVNVPRDLGIMADMLVVLVEGLSE